MYKAILEFLKIITSAAPKLLVKTGSLRLFGSTKFASIVKALSTEKGATAFSKFLISLPAATRRLFRFKISQKTFSLGRSISAVGTRYNFPTLVKIGEKLSSNSARRLVAGTLIFAADSIALDLAVDLSASQLMRLTTAFNELMGTDLTPDDIEELIKQQRLESDIMIESDLYQKVISRLKERGSFSSVLSEGIRRALTESDTRLFMLSLFFSRLDGLDFSMLSHLSRETASVLGENAGLSLAASLHNFCSEDTTLAADSSLKGRLLNNYSNERSYDIDISAIDPLDYAGSEKAKIFLTSLVLAFNPSKLGAFNKRLPDMVVNTPIPELFRTSQSLCLLNRVLLEDSTGTSIKLSEFILKMFIAQAADLFRKFESIVISSLDSYQIKWWFEYAKNLSAEDLSKMKEDLASNFFKEVALRITSHPDDLGLNLLVLLLANPSFLADMSATTAGNLVSEDEVDGSAEDKLACSVFDIIYESPMSTAERYKFLLSVITS